MESEVKLPPSGWKSTVKPKKRTAVVFHIDMTRNPELLAWLERMAAELGSTKSEVARAILTSAMNGEVR